MFHILIWGDLRLCLGRLSRPKPPRGDGTVNTLTHLNYIIFLTK